MRRSTKINAPAVQAPCRWSAPGRGFASTADPMLGLYGAFAYDLVFQMEDLVQKRAREAISATSCCLFRTACWLMTAPLAAAWRCATISHGRVARPKGLPHDTPIAFMRKLRGRVFPITPRAISGHGGNGARAFARGDLFEAVPGQLFAEPCERSPAEVFQRLCRINPSPYGGLVNLGDGEFLVSASPEMFVRRMAAGSRPARFPGPSRAALMPSATPNRSANC